MANADRAAHIRIAMAGLIPGFYSASRFGKDGAKFEQHMTEYMSRYPRERAAAQDVAMRFASMFDPAVADFEAQIGPSPRDVPIYVVISMGEFDGATRQLTDGPALLFGADVIARIHSGHDPRAFVQHELLHVYHGEKFESCALLWCSLWEEGLANHVAHTLNPAASDAELLLTLPRPIRPSLALHRDEAICVTLNRLDSDSDGDYRAFFSFAQFNERLPPRFGYLVGEWVAADLARDRSLPELASMTGAELRLAIERSLRGMASCPAIP